MGRRRKTEYLEETVAQGKASSPIRLELSVHDRKGGEEQARRVDWSQIVNGLDAERFKEGINSRGEKRIRRLLQKSGSVAVVRRGHSGEKHHGYSFGGQTEKDIVSHTYTQV